MDQEIDESDNIKYIKQNKSLEKLYLSTNKILKLYIKEIEKESKKKKSLNKEINELLNEIGYDTN